MKILSAEFIKGIVHHKDAPEDGLPQIAFAGRSNVGKSSLLNALMKRKNLVRVSATPGKTREINFYKVNNAFHLVDLPGLGYAKISKTERANISKTLNGYISNSETLGGLVYLIDLKVCGTEIDLEMIDHLKKNDIPFLPICTKMDKLNTKDRNKNIAKVTEKFGFLEPPLMISSKTGKGLEKLWAELTEAIEQ